MDINDYWQENKRFVVTVASGGVVFLIAYMSLSSNYEGDIQAARRNKIHVQSELGKTWFSNSDLDSVEEQNRALRAAVERLAAHVNFEARPAFRVESGSNDRR